MTDTALREPILVVADILKSEMGLSDEQIVLNFEKWDIPTTPHIYIALQYISSKMIGGNSYSSPNGLDGLNEVQSVSMSHLVQIDIMSFNYEARVRKEEVPMALQSVYSQRKQEQYQIKIARIPSDFLNSSSLEGSKILNRFTTRIFINSIHNKTKSIDFYDTFTGDLNIDPKTESPIEIDVINGGSNE